jgi:hypothetical protein
MTVLSVARISTPINEAPEFKLGATMEELNVFTRLIETHRAQQGLTLFLIQGAGYLIGNIRIGSFSLGPDTSCSER